MAFQFHPIHLAVTEITFKNNSVQIVHKIFIDDLEKQIEVDLKKRGNPQKLNLNSPKENPQTSVYLKEYLKENFSIKLNNKDYTEKYVGQEYEMDAIWIYMEIEKAEVPNKVEISNKILLDIYEDQTDFVHIKINDKKQSGRFERGKTKQIFNFN